MTLRNQNGAGGNITRDEDTNSGTNPKTGQIGRRYCWTCGCCPHWDVIVLKRQKDIKMAQLLKVLWVVVIVVACEIQGKQW